MGRRWDDDGVIGGYAATFEAQDDDGTSVRRTVRARTLVVTIPAHAVGTALNGVLPGSAALLAAADSGGGVPYPPVASFALAYPKSSFLDVDLPDGSGNLRDLPHTWPCCLAQASSPDGYNLLSRTTSSPPWTGISGR